MALTKSISTPFGVDATYWRLRRIELDTINKIFYVDLDGYSSLQARKDGAVPLAVKTVQLCGEKYPIVDGQPISQMAIYGKILLEEEWLDAVPLIFGTDTDLWE